MKNGGKNKSVAFIILFSVFIYVTYIGKQVDAVQVNLTSPDLKDALATNASGCSHLASLLERRSPMQEISGSSPASEQPSETHYI